MVALSACLIVKNDAHLPQAVQSIRPYVDEVCIVDTGSTEECRAEAASLADRFEVFTECNFPDGEIADFSAARTRSLELASHDTVLWLDSDDLINGAEHLQEAIAWCEQESAGQPWRAVFPYEYDHDRDGHCIVLQPRERIVSPKSQFHWQYRVHEGLTCKLQNEWKTLTPPHPITWVHRLDKRKNRSLRNLRILRDDLKGVEPDKVDAKRAFDFGMELLKSGDHSRGIQWLGRFVAVSDLDHERVLACLHIVDALSFWPGREGDAATWAHRALQIWPDAPDGYFALTKIAYQGAQRQRDKARARRDWRRVAYYGAKGLEQRSKVTLASSNPLDREFTIPCMIAEAHDALGEPGKASRAFLACLAARPDDPPTLLRAVDLAEKANPELNAGKIDVIIACGQSSEAWDPHTAATGGIGGSETAVIEMAKRLVERGCRVRVFCGTDKPGLYGGVEYRSMGELSSALRCDILIAWRNAGLLDYLPARVKWIWAHDTEIFNATGWTLHLADRVLALSEWHAEHILETYADLSGTPIWQTRNGIDLARFGACDPARYPHRAIFSSSPDRGLDLILAMWPRIREQVPDATLHVFYGFGSYDVERRRAWEEAAQATPGVTLRGRVDQRALASEMLSAGVWLHPSWTGDEEFHETSCIGAMEAQAAGLRIVASRWGALPETVREGALIDGDPTNETYQAAFVDAVVRAMTDGDDDARVRARAAGERCSWDGVADEWLEAMQLDLERIEPRVPAEPASDGRLLLHAVLSPMASGGVVMDANCPGGEAMGGGSRVGFLGLVEAMAKLGRYRVRAFSTFADPHVIRDGVEYVRLDHFASFGDPDVMLAYYDTSPLSAASPPTLRIASHHTYSPYMHFECADLNTAPSTPALEYLRERYDPFAPWYLLPNAVGEMAIHREPVAGRVIYHTSADRGLELLLHAWPQVRRAVPHATLDVVGYTSTLPDPGKKPGQETGYDRRMRTAAAVAQEAGGVRLLGRLPRATLDLALSRASVFAFPCSPVMPCETFSVSIMECCKIGLPVVLAPADALESIYGGHVRMTPAPARDHMPEFVDALVHVLSDETEQARLSAAGQALARAYTFDRSAKALDRIISRHIGKRARTVFPRDTLLNGELIVAAQ